MRRIGIVFAVLFLSVLAEEPDPAAKVAAMKWMAGTWSGSMWGGEFTAYYSTPEGGKVLSHSFLKKEGRQVFYEFEKFDVQDGEVVMMPFPGGKKAHHLVLVKSEPRRVTFENPKKDYPTRIVYDGTADGKLTITLSDPHGGSKKQEVFRLSR